ncbi:hypothetical protein FKP32DRAFT_1683598, partial [Trametes sanguinea]
MSVTGTALSRSCTIAADLIVIATTWWNATFDGSIRHIRGASKMPLTRVLLYNGATYFLALSTLNILHLTLTMLSVVGVDEPTSVVVVFTDPLTAILVCRFLLALHAANLRSTVQNSQDTEPATFARASNQMTMRFASLDTDPLSATLTGGLEREKDDFDNGDLDMDTSRDDDEPLAESPTSTNTSSKRAFMSPMCEARRGAQGTQLILRTMAALTKTRESYLAVPGPCAVSEHSVSSNASRRSHEALGIRDRVFLVCALV